MSLGDRLFRILKSLAADENFKLSGFLNKSGVLKDDKIKEWAEKLGLRENGAYNEKRGEQWKTRSNTNQSPYSARFVDDLKIFNLTPPSSWEEVKKARKREIKKFHPDKFANEPENMKIAQQIAQIYNAAFERLKKDFKA